MKCFSRSSSPAVCGWSYLVHAIPFFHTDNEMANDKKQKDTDSSLKVDIFTQKHKRIPAPCDASLAWHKQQFLLVGCYPSHSVEVGSEGDLGIGDEDKFCR